MTGNIIQNISDLKLERYYLGELSQKEMALLSEYIDTHPEEQNRLDEIEKSNKEILEQYPVDFITRAIEQQYAGETEAQPKHKSWSLMWKSISIAVPIAAMLLAMIVFAPQFINVPITDTPEVIRIKGSTRLIIQRKRGDEIKFLEANDMARENDVLQIMYFAEHFKYGVIFSIDGNLVITLHYPDTVNETTAIETGKTVQVPSSYQLDNAPNFERFFFISSATEIKIVDVLKAAEKLAKNKNTAMKADLELSENIKQVSTIILKEEKR